MKRSTFLALGAAAVLLGGTLLCTQSNQPFVLAQGTPVPLCNPQDPKCPPDKPPVVEYKQLVKPR